MIKNKLFRKKSIDIILKHAEADNENVQLKKNLGVKDLTAFGIAAIIGAGIFSTIGTAAVNGGPAISLLFIFTAVACGFSAMCYAQFASMIPISGSAYTYTYASFGELIAWIIGWDLIMEYSVGNIAVAISWSDYFTGLMNGISINIPAYLTIDYLSASRGFQSAIENINNGIAFNQLTVSVQEAYYAWQIAPKIFGVRLIADIPAFSIVAVITCLVYIGIYESKVANNIMVLLKVAILLLVVSVGAFYVQPENWSPFAPNGITGIMKGVAGVFFAYIGFDAISTTAEECKSPQRDLPRSMIYALVICTVLYVIISLVLTGMVNYTQLGVGDPLAFVFQKLHLTKLSGIIAISAVIAMAGVLLVFQIGQPRIWMSMSRDGLLPKIFSKLHVRFKTPSFSTILTGVMVAIPCLFLNLTEVTELTSIGTLFAFALVCGGILLIDNNKQPLRKGFKVYYINSRYLLPVILISLTFILYYLNKESITNFFSLADDSWNVFKHKIPTLIFIIITLIIMALSILKKLSLIPVLGLITNLYLMSELGVINWMRFSIWLVIGLLLYFTYGFKHSRLNKE